MLTIHHLGKSQSERIVWLCEELGVPCILKRYTRDATTMLAPPDYKALHPIGTAPVITDGTLVLGESGAIVEYIMGKYGKGRLALDPGHADYAQYLYWLHFANGTLQPTMGRNMLLRRLNLPAENPLVVAHRERLARALGSIEARLATGPFLAGADFTVADIMSVFSLTTMRYFFPVDFTPYPQIRAYLGRIGQRKGYQAAMQQGDPGMALLLT
jgi:glutathione S-transferase